MINTDKNTSIETLKNIFAKFVADRDWDQFHTPKNIAMNLGIEVSELQEILVWHEGKELDLIVKEKKKDIENEVADIVFNLFQFCTNCNIDITRAVENKIPLIANKYPVEECKGRNDVYIEDGKIKKL